jgi:glycosyltransferase involved in cell wall biosynthesis
MYLMPSHSEGSPNALLEAMQAGLPIIASAVGGIPEMVTSGRDAILVPSRRPPALADAIERLLGNPAEAAQMAESALKETSRFTYDAYYRSLIEVYRRVLGASDLVETRADA